MVHKLLKKWCCLAGCLFIGFHALAQDIVTGRVTDEGGTPLEGVSVSVKNTANSTSTNAEGHYSVGAKQGNVLVFGYVGYGTQEMEVGDNLTLDIKLVPKQEALDEVVVVGYGTLKRRDVTGAIASVSGQKMSEYVVPNPIQGLQGRAAGVMVTTNTGAPNGDFTVRIRGSNSIRGGNDPLYIIDGMPSSPSSINSLDIESVEILKDASATAIYGSRAANGVVLITTKRGKSGAASIAYDVNYGIQSQIKKLDMMNATEWATFYNEQQLNDVGKTYFTDEQIAAMGIGLDWQSLVFQDAPIQNHNLMVMGGTEKARVLVSASAMTRDGIIPNSKYDKYNLRSNIDYNFNDRFDLQLNMVYTRTGRSDQNSGGGNRGGSLIGGTLASPPSLQPYNEDGSYRNLQLAYPFMSNALLNPFNILNETSSKTNANLGNINLALGYELIKGLSLRTSLGIENNDYQTDYYRTSKYLYGSSNASITNQHDMTIVNENILNYHTEINDHELDAVGGFTYQQYIGKSSSMSGSDFISDAPQTGQISGASIFGIPSSGYTKWVLMSYLGRINYSFKGKYVATVSARADGSSRYSKGDKWGFFPSAALAWRISQEQFLSDVDWLSELKLRAGYGRTGSTAISPYATLNMLSQGKTPINGDMGTFYAPSTTLPANLRWETTDQVNIGLDIGLLTNRLRITADYYDKITKDLLNAVILPPSSGYGNTIRNIGKMGNKGIEVMVEGDVISKEQLRWTLSGNISTNRNKVISLYGGDDVYGSNVNLSYINDFIHLIREGEPMGVFFTYKENGYTDDGNLQYVDRDDNGTLSVADKVITGNPYPDFTYGINSDLSYKGFDFSFFFQGSQGNDLFNVGETANLDQGMGLNLRREVLYSHWKPDNSPEVNAAAKYPRVSRSIAVQYSDRFIEDASYLRLKNISLGYNLPLRQWGVQWCNQLKVYVSAQNIWTITKYTGMDPEVNSLDGNINIGVDYLRYPNVKTVSFGARVQF